MELQAYFDSISAFTDYPAGTSGFTYAFSRLPELTETFAQFDLPAIAGQGDTLARTRRILQWVADCTAYDGASPLGPALPAKIIRFGIEEGKPINCANRAILFCDALVSLGIFAHPVWLEHRPCDPHTRRPADECHCHVIAQVWLPECGAWAAFDPSFNLCFTDSTGRPISIPAMLTAQRQGTPVCAIDNRTGKPTADGTLCTAIGLLCVSVITGNAFVYRYKWVNLHYLTPAAYLSVLAEAPTDDGWAGWQTRILHNSVLCMDDLNSAPHWID